MRQWLNQNMQALRLVLSRMGGNKLSTLIMCCVIGVALCLPGVLYVIVDNLNDLTGNIKSEPRISLFLKLDIKTEDIDAIGKKLAGHPSIRHHDFVSKDSAWEQLQKNEATAGIAGNLESNPLPDAFFVQPKVLDSVAVNQLQKELQQLPGVELAQVDADWIKRLNSLLELGKRAVLAIAVLLGFALVAIIGNTIRMQILTQREEIEVSKLIGATDRFIRRPFLYAGTLYGLGGGTAACLILAGVIWLFNYSVAEIAALYASDFRLQLPSANVSLTIIAAAVVSGWLASYIAVNRSLAQFESS